MRKARLTLPAWRDGAHQHALADVVSGHAGADLVDHTDRLVPDRQSGPDRILSADDVDVGAANRRQADSYHSLAGAGLRDRLLLQPEPAWASKDVGLHESPHEGVRRVFLHRQSHT